MKSLDFCSKHGDKVQTQYKTFDNLTTLTGWQCFHHHTYEKSLFHKHISSWHHYTRASAFSHMHKDKQRFKNCCAWSVAWWAICICRYEGHDYPSKPVTPLIYMSIALQRAEHCQLTKAGERVPNLQPSLPVCSNLQPLFLQAVMTTGGIQPHVILRPFIPSLLACCICQIKIEMSSKKIVWSLIHRHNNHVKENSTA